MHFCHLLLLQLLTLFYSCCCCLLRALLHCHFFLKWSDVNRIYTMHTYQHKSRNIYSCNVEISMSNVLFRLVFFSLIFLYFCCYFFFSLHYSMARVCMVLVVVGFVFISVALWPFSRSLGFCILFHTLCAKPFLFLPSTTHFMLCMRCAYTHWCS